MASWVQCTIGKDRSPVYINVENVIAMKRYDGWTMLTFVSGEKSSLSVHETPEDIIAGARAR